MPAAANRTRSGVEACDLPLSAMHGPSGVDEGSRNVGTGAAEPIDDLTVMGSATGLTVRTTVRVAAAKPCVSTGLAVRAAADSCMAAKPRASTGLFVRSPSGNAPRASTGLAVRTDTGILVASVGLPAGAAAAAAER